MDHVDPLSTLHTDSHQAPDWTALNLIGESPAFREMLYLVQHWAEVDATVLLSGESGTGKELVAHAVHRCSERRAGPFVPVNCGAIPDDLFESALFGHAKGAFTDAKDESLGLARQAEGGTLFLDEIEALSARGQAAILRFVENLSYRPVGSTYLHHADVRLVAATNANLEAMSSSGQFRHDLLYRFDLLTLQLPPLRVRTGDPLLLAETFVRRLSEKYRMPVRGLDAASRVALQGSYPWPGNVRELEHRVHRRFLLSRGPFVDLGLAPSSPQTDGGLAGAPEEWSFAAAKARAIAEFEVNYVRNLLTHTRGNLSEAARLAGKDRSRFGRLVKKYGLHRAAFG
jgi:DNA-binding NtrC family response regulator